MASVGGSIGCAGIASVTEGSHTVSATVAFSRPAIETMSPALPSSIGVRSRPRKASTLETRPCSTSEPSRARTFTVWFGFTEPAATRPVRMRPRKGSELMVVPSMRNGPGSTVGGGTWAMTVSKRADMSVVFRAGSLLIQPFLADP